MPRRDAADSHAGANRLDFRGFLQAELVRRCSSNRSYSLRAFANFLDIDHSSLSQMLRGKRRMTAAIVARFCRRLGLDERCSERYVAAASDRPHEHPATVHEAIVQVVRDAAALLDELSGFAILELVRLPGFRADSRWIAGVLGIPVDEVNIALHRLLRLGLLEMIDAGAWRDRRGDNACASGDRSIATVRRLLDVIRTLARTDARTSSRRTGT